MPSAAASASPTRASSGVYSPARATVDRPHRALLPYPVRPALPRRHADVPAPHPPPLPEILLPMPRRDTTPLDRRTQQRHAARRLAAARRRETDDPRMDRERRLLHHADEAYRHRQGPAMVGIPQAGETRRLPRTETRPR